MKLDRHKLSFTLSNNNKTLQLGEANISLLFIITNVVAPISIGLFFIVLTLLGILPWMRFITALLVAVPVGYGIYGASAMSKKKASNKNIKIIEDGRVILISENKEQEFKKEQIADFIIFKNPDTHQDLMEGILYLVDQNGNKHQLMALWDTELKYLDDDLEYFKDYFKMLVGH